MVAIVDVPAMRSGGGWYVVWTCGGDGEGVGSACASDPDARRGSEVRMESGDVDAKTNELRSLGLARDLHLRLALE